MVNIKSHTILAYKMEEWTTCSTSLCPLPTIIEPPPTSPLLLPLFYPSLLFLETTPLVELLSRSFNISSLKGCSKSSRGHSKGEKYYDDDMSSEWRRFFNETCRRYLNRQGDSRRWSIASQRRGRLGFAIGERGKLFRILIFIWGNAFCWKCNKCEFW